MANEKIEVTNEMVEAALEIMTSNDEYGGLPTSRVVREMIEQSLLLLPPSRLYKTELNQKQVR